MNVLCLFATCGSRYVVRYVHLSTPYISASKPMQRATRRIRRQALCFIFFFVLSCTRSKRRCTLLVDMDYYIHTHHIRHKASIPCQSHTTLHNWVMTDRAALYATRAVDKIGSSHDHRHISLTHTHTNTLANETNSFFVYHNTQRCGLGLPFIQVYYLAVDLDLSLFRARARAQSARRDLLDTATADFASCFG